MWWEDYPGGGIFSGGQKINTLLAVGGGRE